MKNLVYFVCIPHDQMHTRKLRMAIESLYLTQKNSKTFDVLVLTVQAFEHEVRNATSSFAVDSFDIHVFSLPAVLGKGYCARYQLFEWKLIWKYQKALYLDTDVVALGPIEQLFEEMDGRSLHLLTVRESVEDCKYDKFGTRLLDDESFEGNRPHVNSGQLGFPICDETHRFFVRLYVWIEKDVWNDWGKDDFFCDQICLNYASATFDQLSIDYDLFDRRIALKTMPADQESADAIVLLHLAGVQHAMPKEEIMDYHVTTLRARQVKR